jgi:S-adenosylmethionine decarboxylase proenzyme
MKGIQIIASFINCKHQMLLIDEFKFKTEISNCITKSGLTEVGNKIYKFKNQGITGVFLLAESHVAIHTWPELNNSLTLDIFVCNYTKNNTKKAENLYLLLKKLYSPQIIKDKRVNR